MAYLHGVQSAEGSPHDAKSRATRTPDDANNRAAHSIPNFPIVFTPLFVSDASFACFVVMNVWLIMYYVFNAITVHMGTASLVAQNLGTLFVLSLMGCCMTHGLRSYLRDRATMREQISNFDFDASRCSDNRSREMITRTVIRWYGNVDTFNVYVRTALRGRLNEVLSGDLVVPGNFLVAGAFPLIFHGLDLTAAWLRHGDLNRAVAKFLAHSCNLPIWALFLQVSLMTSKCMRSRRRSTCLDIFQSAVVGTFFGFTMASLWWVKQFLCSSPWSAGATALCMWTFTLVCRMLSRHYS